MYIFWECTCHCSAFWDHLLCKMFHLHHKGMFRVTSICHDKASRNNLFSMSLQFLITTATVNNWIKVEMHTSNWKHTATTTESLSKWMHLSKVGTTKYDRWQHIVVFSTWRLLDHTYTVYVGSSLGLGADLKIYQERVMACFLYYISM